MTDKNKLLNLIVEAFEAGTYSTSEFSRLYAETKIDNFLECLSVKVSGDSRIYKVEELKKKQVGTRFKHKRLGIGHLELIDNDLAMAFDNGDLVYVYEDEEPWDEPMEEMTQL